MAIPHRAITPPDKLSFTIFLAVALHAAIILGVGFKAIDSTRIAHSMEVTLAQFERKHKPDEADYLAQLNQSGSGSLTHKKLLKLPTPPRIPATLLEETTPVPLAATAPEVPASQADVVTSISPSDNSIDKPDDRSLDLPAATAAIKRNTLWQRSLAIASLTAKLDQQRQAYAKRPRIKRLTSLSTAASSDAFYLNSWRRKVEKIGNLNYPTEARKNKIYGSLRLLVALMPDGHLWRIELLESSGHPVLDAAAIRIVKLAAPFAPFPDELRHTADRIEIIRTWQFRRNNALYSY